MPRIEPKTRDDLPEHLVSRREVRDSRPDLHDHPGDICAWDRPLRLTGDGGGASFAGDDDRPAVNQFLLQPFVNYNLQDGWYLVTAPIFVANWNVEASKRWVAPVGAGVGRVFKIGKQIAEALRIHRGMSKQRAEERVVELLRVPGGDGRGVRARQRR